jgi:hypothetical protein
MAGKIKTFFRDQPFLAGCAGFLVMVAIMCAGFAALAGVGFMSCLNCMGQGLDSYPQTTADASEAGFMLGVNYVNGEVTYALTPNVPREVTCADLEAIMFPHLTGEMETVRIESISYSTDGSGEMNAIPIDCTYSGYPSAANYSAGSSP